MKYTLIIPQSGVVRCGLLGKVGLAELCLLDYLSGWFFSPKARRIVVQGAEFVWVHYARAVEEMPLLFNPNASLATRKNQLVLLVRNLRSVGLIETAKGGRHLYFRKTLLAVALAQWDASSTAKAAPTRARLHDDTATPSHDKTITKPRDASPPPIINESATTKALSNETITPIAPFQGANVDSSSPSVDLLTQQAESIYRLYPRQIGKPTALRAIRRQLQTHSFDYLAERTRLFAASYTGDARFIPHPSTWFNQQRFNDQPATWQNAGSPGKPVSLPRHYDSANYNQPLEKF